MFQPTTTKPMKKHVIFHKSDRQQGNLNNSDQKHQSKAFDYKTEADIKGDAGNTTTGLLLSLH